MFQATRQRLAFWYTTVTAVLLLLFAGGMYWYVHSTLVERVDDTLNHVVEVVQRSLVIEADPLHHPGGLHVNLEASFPDNSAAAEDDHIDLEWFDPQGQLIWSTFADPPNIPLHLALNGETVHRPDVATDPTRDPLLRQVTQRIEAGNQTLGYLRVSHPWFEVTKPSRELLLDLCLGISVMIGSVAAIGWLLSGLAIAPIRESYQRLKQFTADASHELRNPVASIQTNVQVALADPEPDGTVQRQQMEVIERLTRRLGRLVDDLLFLARQDSGIVQSQWRSLNLRSLLNHILEEQAAVACRKMIHLGWANDTPDTEKPNEDAVALLVTADRDELERLFTNLVSNAIQYTPENGRVTVDVSTVRKGSASLIQVVVSDTGVGIAADAIPQLFERFYRVDPARSRQSAATTTGTSGSGLGLAIAKAIVDHHQGQIRIDSEVNQGTTVTVWLPETLSSPWPRLSAESVSRK